MASGLAKLEGSHVIAKFVYALLSRPSRAGVDLETRFKAGTVISSVTNTLVIHVLGMG